MEIIYLLFGIAIGYVITVAIKRRKEKKRAYTKSYVILTDNNHWAGYAYSITEVELLDYVNACVDNLKFDGITDYKEFIIYEVNPKQVSITT